MSFIRYLRKISNILTNSQSSKYGKKDFLKSIPDNINILEMGPFYSPMQRGEKVKYFDVLDQQELIDRAKKLGLSHVVENIPYIHYVSPTADLTIIEEKFEALFSSHVIEHQFDLIDHLQKASDLLYDGGKYYLIVPDKRFCFDHYQQASTIADVIYAHYQKRKKHSLKHVLEHRAFITHNVAVDHWYGKHGKLTGVTTKIKEAMQEYEALDYLDVHALFFTPDSFLEIMNLLFESKYIDFKVSRIHETQVNKFEFFCVLEKSGDSNSK